MQVKEISVLRDKKNITVDMQENKISHVTEEINQSRQKKDKYMDLEKNNRARKKRNQIRRVRERRD